MLCGFACVQGCAAGATVVLDNGLVTNLEWLHRCLVFLVWLVTERKSVAAISRATICSPENMHISYTSVVASTLHHLQL